ncbi:MAG: TrkH family potassium uptake protein [Solirubrobacteraceae bacterium]|nr:TrkH family potassium uptake protein [Solirubrobacteraceae bacterium]
MSARRRLPIGPNTALVLLTLGGTFAVCALGLAACAVVGLFDGRAAGAFALCAAGSLALSAVCLRPARRTARGLAVRPLGGLLAVTLAWSGASVVGAVALLAAGTFGSPLDALFEATSGFTTTGATLLYPIEGQPDAVLLWRSVMQWLGGVGIVVVVVAIAPVSGPAVQRAFYAETSGITTERLTPRIIDTAKIIGGIYLVLSAAAVIAYLAAGMGGFDAFNHAMTSVSTAGFSTRDASIGGFDSLPIELVAIAFMIFGGINFGFYWRAVRGKPTMPQGAEVLAFLGILAGAIAAIAVSVELAGDASLREAAFNVTSIVTTTGYASADFSAWNDFSRVALLVLFSSGACAASTAGGIKVIRSVLLLKAARQEIDRPLNPLVVRVLRFGGHAYSEDVRRAVLGYFLVYAIVIVAGTLAMATTGVDPITAISAASSALNLIGPGLGTIGPDTTWQALPDFGRAVAILLMITGRLEVFTIVALLAAIFRFRR